MERSGPILRAVLRVRHPLPTGLALSLAAGALPLAGAFLLPRAGPILGPQAYLVFHVAVELFSVVVAFSIFGVGWYGHDLSGDRRALLLSGAFLAVGLIDLAHLLSYPGMPDLVTPNTTDKASQLWVAGRAITAGALLACPLVARRRGARWLRRAVVGPAGLALALVAIGAVLFFPERVPAMYVPGAGQTALKRAAEYVLVAAMVAAMVAHALRRERARDPTTVLYLAALALLSLAEVCFAAYVRVADVWNTLGHAYKAAGFYLVYRGMFIAAVREPYARLFETTQALEREMARGDAARTALARSAAELAQERDRLTTIMEASPVAMSRLDRTGLIRYANAAAERILGLRGADLAARPLDTAGWRLTDPSGGPLPPEALPFPSLARTRGPIRLRYAASWPGGRRAAVELTGAPLLDPDGALDGAVVAFEDVTERSRLEEQLRQAQKMEAVGRLAGGVAHDFNNLLTAILADAGHLLEGLPEGTPLREDAADIQEAAGRGATLTRQLLTFSRKQAIAPRLVALDELVLGFMPMLQRLVGDEVQLEARTGAAGHVRVDPVQIEQVIMNLVVNARDAMPAGGRIAVETENLALDPEQARAQLGVRPGPFVVLTIRDGGTGMDAEVLSHLFEPFFTTKEPGRGTGLGLSTVYGIVRQAGGHVTVRSAKGAGTEFRVWLPRAEASAEEPAPPAAPARSRAG